MSCFVNFCEEKLKKNRKKKMSWCSDAPEDEAISLFAGLLANPDVPLSRCMYETRELTIWILAVVSPSWGAPAPFQFFRAGGL